MRLIAALGSRIFTPSRDRKSTRLNSSHGYISYAVFCLKKKNNSSTYPGCAAGRPQTGKVLRATRLTDTPGGRTGGGPSHSTQGEHHALLRHWLHLSDAG